MIIFVVLHTEWCKWHFCVHFIFCCSILNVKLLNRITWARMKVFACCHLLSQCQNEDGKRHDFHAHYVCGYGMVRMYEKSPKIPHKCYTIKTRYRDSISFILFHFISLLLYVGAWFSTAFVRISAWIAIQLESFSVILVVLIDYLLCQQFSLIISEHAWEPLENRERHSTEVRIPFMHSTMWKNHEMKKSEFLSKFFLLRMQFPTAFSGKYEFIIAIIGWNLCSLTSIVPY